ncbi:DNA-binding protein [Romboutsia lituseburensis]|uniref:DNA-binding protein n=1 Tax=Romboutsia lituseburensis TaxID=1537 RepID=UPI00215B65C5|nr:DNA-binding protein [Romboutsia lituseburensis]MCR8744949.1 DNA-binding protein [Romboutsia lituseburensis]
MKGNERLKKFIELQEKEMEFENISKEIGIMPKTLRAFLNKNGYKLENGKYKLKEDSEASQIAFKEIKKEESKKKKSEPEIKKSRSSKIDGENKENKKNVLTKTTTKLKENKKITTKPKKDRKINITTEDLDKLCEVYDWYLQVKDYKSLKPKKIVSKKDINIEKKELKELKSASIRVEKSIWEEFERLCSNSQFTKQEIITQALKDFMSEYKHLL